MTPPEEGPHGEAGYVGTQAVIPSLCLWEAEMGIAQEASQPRVPSSEGKKQEPLSKAEESQV